MKAQIWNYNGWIAETRPDILNGIYKPQLERAGFRILDTIHYLFEPQGFTALYLLGESHFAVHTFPEEGKTYIELSSCCKPQFDAFMAEETKANRRLNE